MAIGIGDMTVRSYINQPLQADIAVLQPDGLLESEVIASLASPDDYGGSVKPSEVSAYTLPTLAADVAAVAAALAPEPAVLFGHDWGAPIAYHTALLYPEQFRAVAGLSVPYSPPSPTPFIEVAEALYADRFFYQNFFQAPGVAKYQLPIDPDRLQSLVSECHKICGRTDSDRPLTR